MSLDQMEEIRRRFADQLGVTIVEAIGPDGTLSEAARGIYADVMGDAPVFA